MTRALIIGGGIAGPVLAVALQSVGIDSVIYERGSADDDRRGAWISFQANGMDALRAIGLAGPVEGIGYETDDISFVNGKGKPLGRMPMAARRPDGQTSILMPRADLYALLAGQAADRGIRIEYGKEFVGAEETATGVRARFADGSTADGDFLVGADGIHSRVRQVIDPGAAAPRYVPVLNTGGYIPNFSLDAPDREFVMQFGTRCFFAWMKTPDGGAVWFANPPMPKEPAKGVLSGMSDADWRNWLRELMAGDAGPALDILDAAPGPLTGWTTYDMPVVENWHDGRGRMVLIGDAAHATSPSAGQGAAMSLEDAVILAQCLRDCSSTARAFETFVSLRRERVEKIVAYGHRGSARKAAGPVARVIRDAILPIGFRRAARDGGESMMWLQGHHIDFASKVA
ncbi:MAG: FAD-dependent monooxygenase [Microbacterium sp.]|jgi:2-polyprenyl-6-methoxyphenol hydroxylase-like FAD-dependent oxidoreductase|uniref:FAD-dependent oxidoreductase n=1 Tax=Microbacterium sp. TaxID=51671 RepID=UPI00281F9928|nr:FAD-dependent monooxygenase [Microbacterium sp.]MDR2321589.1 FAD-dependent monooxygenase [Microbacterium sp.]